ncbi:MAG: hypothetical protein J7M14_06795 [Planctomycetes bacterium]|nr:hypothetical protein [Planctomycetota bacterium]
MRKHPGYGEEMLQEKEFLSQEEACRELEKNAGTQFDPRAVATFFNVFHRNRVT